MATDFRFPATMEMARAKLKEIARKYPQINPEEVLATAQTETHFIEEPIKVDFTLSDGSLRSIVKTALAMTFDAGISPGAGEVAMQYLRSNGRPAWSAFHERDLVINRPARQITHAVSVRANPGSETILAYVEYFSAFRYVVDLSHNYVGPPIQKTIAFDPVTWLPVDLEVDLALTAGEYARMVEGCTWSLAESQKALNYALPIALEALDKRQLNNEIGRAIKDGFETLGVKPGDDLPNEKFQEFSKIVSERVTQYVARMPRRFDLAP